MIDTYDERDYDEDAFIRSGHRSYDRWLEARDLEQRAYQFRKDSLMKNAPEGVKHDRWPVVKLHAWRRTANTVEYYVSILNLRDLSVSQMWSTQLRDPNNLLPAFRAETAELTASAA